jgi:predicted aspartyl protease
VERRVTFRKNAKNSRLKRSGQENQRSEAMGNGDGLSARSWQTVSAIQYAVSVKIRKNIELEVKESKSRRLKFLLDTGADICLIKSTELLGTTEFNPKQRVKVKSVDGSIVETHGVVKICAHEGNQIFHLVNNQVELVCDGIVGRDFLQHTGAKVCYNSNTVTFKTDNEEWTKKILGSKIVQGTVEVRKLTLPGR